MKFEYDDVTEDREMVAFVDDDGDLCINTRDGVIYHLKDGGGFHDDGRAFESYAYDNGVRKAFSPGDKITITF